MKWNHLTTKQRVLWVILLYLNLKEHRNHDYSELGRDDGTQEDVIR